MHLAAVVSSALHFVPVVPTLPQLCHHGKRDRGGSAEAWNTDGMDLVVLVMARRPIIVWRYSFVSKAVVHEDPYRVWDR